MPTALHDAVMRMSPSQRPTIVHIVLDGYSRQDVLRQFYGFDNAAFIGKLRDLGFAVADRATSSYMQTLISMRSVFSANYINDILLASGADDATCRTPDSTTRATSPAASPHLEGPHQRFLEPSSDILRRQVEPIASSAATGAVRHQPALLADGGVRFAVLVLPGIPA